MDYSKEELVSKRRFKNARAYSTGTMGAFVAGIVGGGVGLAMVITEEILLAIPAILVTTVGAEAGYRKLAEDRVLLFDSINPIYQGQLADTLGDEVINDKDVRISESAVEFATKLTEILN